MSQFWISIFLSDGDIKPIILSTFRYALDRDAKIPTKNKTALSIAANFHWQTSITRIKFQQSTSTIVYFISQARKFIYFRDSWSNIFQK
jgi:hypothetical protein